MNILFAHETRSEPQVAVLVPLYNYSQYIVQALDSVAAQTQQDVELIVCNDCSTDDSASVALAWMERHAKYFCRAALIENDVNSGLSASRNAAVAYSRSPYCFMLDADNMIYPHCLERSLEALKEAPDEAAFAYSLREVFDESNPRWRKLENLPDWDTAWLSTANVIDAMVLHRRVALLRVGGYEEGEPFGRLGLEDLELWFKYARAGMFGIKLHQPLIRYRVHGASMMHVTTTKAQALQALWKALRERYPEFFPSLAPAGRE